MAGSTVNAEGDAKKAGAEFAAMFVSLVDGGKSVAAAVPGSDAQKELIDNQGPVVGLLLDQLDANRVKSGPNKGALNPAFVAAVMAELPKYRNPQDPTTNYSNLLASAMDDKRDTTGAKTGPMQVTYGDLSKLVQSVPELFEAFSSGKEPSGAQEKLLRKNHGDNLTWSIHDRAESSRYAAAHPAEKAPSVAVRQRVMPPAPAVPNYTVKASPLTARGQQRTVPTASPATNYDVKVTPVYAMRPGGISPPAEQAPAAVPNTWGTAVWPTDPKTHKSVKTPLSGKNRPLSLGITDPSGTAIKMVKNNLDLDGTLDIFLTAGKKPEYSLIANATSLVAKDNQSGEVVGEWALSKSKGAVVKKPLPADVPFVLGSVMDFTLYESPALQTRPIADNVYKPSGGVATRWDEVTPDEQDLLTRLEKAKSPPGTNLFATMIFSGSMRLPFTVTLPNGAFTVDHSMEVSPPKDKDGAKILIMVDAEEGKIYYKQKGDLITKTLEGSSTPMEAYQLKRTRVPPFFGAEKVSVVAMALPPSPSEITMNFHGTKVDLTQLAANRKKPSDNRFAME
jgi:hypothetical protein